MLNLSGRPAGGRQVAIFALLAAVLLAFGGGPARAETGPAHAFSFTSIDGEPLPMAQFAGKAVLVVNTASRCGFTPQYEGLQSLWERYRDRGLVVLGVPSNDFRGQEPGTEAEIKAFCEVHFAVDFPMTEKQAVIGAGAHPFYRWAAATGGRAQTPRWNFHKYLVAPDGSLAGAIPTQVAPTHPDVIAAIETVLPE